MDDHSGLWIDVELVREAIAEEVQFMEWLPVWERSSCASQERAVTLSTIVDLQ